MGRLPPTPLQKQVTVLAPHRIILLLCHHLALSVHTKDWETFPFQRQDMMGQMMINGMLGFNEVIANFK